jgi:ABC-type branched-subunit amino acid transport system substrate-binding protein
VSHRRKAAAVATVGSLVAVGALVATTAAPARTAHVAAPAKTCSFQLRIGDVLPFTGDLAAYGANLDRAVKLGVDLQNKALSSAGLGGKASVKLVASEDGQTQAAASVEAATKLVKSDKVNVIIGEMASGATIPMAQSVTIPNKIVQISPTSSVPQITSIKDNGYLWRTYPSDALQGRVLAQAAIDAFGKGATVNVGARNDAFGTALRQLFVAQYTKLGGKVGVNISWNPDQPNFDTEAQKLADGNPAGWVIIDFPDTFEKFAPSLVRTGKWSAAKTLMTEALRNGDVLSKIGDPVNGLRGTAASAAGGPAGKAFAAYWKAKVKGAKPYTSFEGTALDAANVAFLAAVKACSASPAKIKANLRAVSGPPGTKVTFLTLAKAVKLLRAGKDVDYEGAFSPVDFDANGDIGSAVFEIWKYDGSGKISTLKTITFRGR